jgi:hypothetical protein
MYTPGIIVTGPNLLIVALYSVRAAAPLNKVEKTTSLISLLALYRAADNINTLPADSSCNALRNYPQVFVTCTL